VAVLSHLGYLEGMDFAWLDALLAVNPPEGSVRAVKLVTAGDDDFAALGMRPAPGVFPRPLLARAIDRLSEDRAAVVVVDLLLDLPAPGDESVERALAQARDRGTVVVLACSRGPMGYRWPLRRFAKNARVACADLLSGPQGEARTIDPIVDTPEGPKRAVAVAAYEAMHLRGVGTADVPKRPVVIHFRENGATFATYGLVDLLRGKVPAEWLKGAAVILGRTDTVGADMHTVAIPPRAGDAGSALQPMSGPEIQANALGTLLGHRPPMRTTPAMDVGLQASAAAVLALLLLWLGPAGGGCLGFILVIGLGLTASIAVFRSSGYMLNFAPTLVALVAYTWLAAWLQDRRLVGALGQLVGRDVARQVGRSLDFRAGAGRVAPISVLVFDVRGSSRMASESPPEAVGALLNHVLGAVGHTVLAHRGMVNKFLGDGLMALFLPGMGGDDHAAQAVAAAKDIAATLPGKAGRRGRRRVGEELDFVVGVHSGPAWVGFVGLPGRLEFTAVGDAVNVAFELQVEAKRLGCRILVSEQTAEASGAADIAQWRSYRVDLPDQGTEIDCYGLAAREESGHDDDTCSKTDGGGGAGDPSGGDGAGG
jgi:class 3 adenylate cyclase